MAGLVEQIEQFEKAQKQLKESTREARSALKALNHERKMVERLLEAIQTVAEDRANQIIAEAVGPQLKFFAAELSAHQHVMLDTIMSAFSDLLHILIEGKENGRGDSVIATCEQVLAQKTKDVQHELATRHQFTGFSIPDDPQA